MLDDHTKVCLRTRASRCWMLMNDSEKHGCKFFLLPLWTRQKDLGGKAPDEEWETLERHGLEYLARQLLKLAEPRGGVNVW